MADDDNASSVAPENAGTAIVINVTPDVSDSNDTIGETIAEPIDDTVSETPHIVLEDTVSENEDIIESSFVEPVVDVIEPDSIPESPDESVTADIQDETVESAADSEELAVADSAGEVKKDVDKDTPPVVKEAENDAGGGTSKKKDTRPNRKLGWRAYVLGGSGGTR